MSFSHRLPNLTNMTFRAQESAFAAVPSPEPISLLGRGNFLPASITDTGNINGGNTNGGGSRSGNQPMLRQSSSCARWQLLIPTHTLLVATLQVFFFYALDSAAYFGLRIPLCPADWWHWGGLITVVFSHGDEIHLWSNTILLLVLGYIVEIGCGTRLAVLTYWFGGLFGAISTVAMWRGDANLLVGASGAIYALWGAILGELLVNFNESYDDLKPWLAQAMGARAQKCSIRVARIGTAILLASAILIELAMHASQPSTNIAHDAHFFGGLYGLLLAFIFAPNLVIYVWEKRVGDLIVFVIIGLVVTSISGLIVRMVQWTREGRC